jgi:hypothetical protein
MIISYIFSMKLLGTRFDKVITVITLFTSFVLTCTAQIPVIK